mmetsp:Transcript_149094/g.478866  ORF Transcript_149094/g.478866 Transcript_149094/m.478866 type:complete len:858 (-) Transcript_149094:156-2729(-)
MGHAGMPIFLKASLCLAALCAPAAALVGQALETSSASQAQTKGLAWLDMLRERRVLRRRKTTPELIANASPASQSDTAPGTNARQARRLNPGGGRASFGQLTWPAGSIGPYPALAAAPPSNGWLSSAGAPAGLQQQGMGFAADAALASAAADLDARAASSTSGGSPPAVAAAAAPSIHLGEAEAHGAALKEGPARQPGRCLFCHSEEQATTQGALQVEGGWFDIDMSKVLLKDFKILMLVMCGVALLGALSFEFLHKKYADVDLETAMRFGDEAQEHTLAGMCKGVWPLVKPYLDQPGNCQWYYILATVFLGLWGLFLGFLFTLWAKEFWDIMEKKEGEKFLPIMTDFIILATTIILVNVYASYVGMMMVIHWRRWMTFWMLGTWLGDKTFYQLQLAQNSGFLDNPDQRIQEDINMFIPTLIALVTGLAESVGQLLINLPLLILLSPKEAFGRFYCPGWLFYIAVLYSGVGTVAAHLIGGKLILINFARQKYEADFRYSIVQVRDHAESIALYGSEECERGQMESRFDSIARVWWMMMLYTKRLQFFTMFYMQTSITFPYLVLAPSYFKGQISLGSMFMLFRALGSVKGAFDFIIQSYGSLTEFRATADRLRNFQAAIGDRKNKTEVVFTPLTKAESTGTTLLASNMDIWLPPGSGDRAVWKDAGLAVREGEFVLLTAPSGSGKSCFFRALGGIWPHARGAVRLPENTLFVPQRSYIPQGSLKQALAYPETEDTFSDEEANHAIEAVGLKSVLANRDLSSVANWELVLSGGEQQRMAIAHAVLKRPQLLLLDEATSAMGEELAVEIYRLLRKPGVLSEGASVVSISHDVTLLSPLHDSCYSYNAEQSAWTKAFQKLT